MLVLVTGAWLWRRVRSARQARQARLSPGLMAWSVVEYVAIEEDFRIVRFEALRIGTTPASYQWPDLILLTPLREIGVGHLFSGLER